jgi:hypothetical protein
MVLRMSKFCPSIKRKDSRGVGSGLRADLLCGSARDTLSAPGATQDYR